ncbi:NC domain-containing-related-like protein [Hibiscus syriacus]|uniref:NC domain-containing-related-like protein n=1 Tax=Hibiscus syriacus TaxID=106335 RepID=A0A6A3ALQ2_HIBSY|nr:NC domain-containing-related-like protein [Hibiscus syriacus]
MVMMDSLGFVGMEVEIADGLRKNKGLKQARSVAAILVKGVDMLEGDRQHGRRGPECLALSWWEFLQFRYIGPLMESDEWASIAMLAGKTMAKSGLFLESFLFNPLYISAPIERIEDETLKHGIRFAGTIIRAGQAFANAKNDENKDSKTEVENKDPFSAISGWIPCLFVNREDPICSEYIVGVQGVESSEPLHLLPSANLIVNLSPSQDFKQARGLCQWWRPDLDLKCYF